MRKRVLFILAFSLFGAAMALHAQQNRGTFSARGQNVSEWAKVQTRLKEKNAKGYAEVEKLAKTNLGAAFFKMGELARESGIDVPRNTGNRRTQRGGEGGGFGQDRRSGMGMGRAGFGPGAMNSERKKVEADLKVKYPVDFAKYEKEKEAASSSILALAKKAGVKLPATGEEIAALRVKYAKELEVAGKESPRASMEKLVELAEKDGYSVSLMNRGRGVRHGEESSEKAPEAPQRENIAMKMSLFREKYPEEMKRYDSLRKTDRTAARDLLKAIQKKLDAEKKSRE